jgi:colanic acid/amylovoran biosynthesis glycosyltransferase
VSAGPIVNVARSFGGLTEPFIRQRVKVGLPEVRSELWFERAIGQLPEGSRQIRVPLIRPGSPGDRVYHRLPQLGPVLAAGYRDAERTDQPRLIHAHFATTGYLVGMVTRSPLVVSAYGFDVSVLGRQRLWRRAYRQLARRAAIVLVEGPFMRARVIDLGFAADSVRVLRIGASLQDVEYREPTTVGDRPLRLLACGRLIEKKGHALAIQAFAAVRGELPAGSTLEIVGAGPLGGKLRALARCLGVSDGVAFVGSLSRVSFHARLARADLFLAPSVTATNGDSEGGAPTTILDAQATGTIVVASTHADIPYIVDDGQTGYLAPEGSAEALARRIAYAVRDHERWPILAAAARQTILERHSDATVSAALRDVYREVVVGWIGG